MGDLVREERERCERATEALRAGRITPDAWARETTSYWRRLAARLWRGWRRKLPAWVEYEDVAQEVPVLALRALPRYDASRTEGTAWQFISWSAYHRGGRLLEHWRGASLHGRAVENPSRAEVAFSRAFPAAPGERELDPLARLPVAPEQERRAEEGERFRDALRGCQSVRQALVLLALRHADGSVRHAARVLYESFPARVECDLRDEEHARRVVAESVTRIAARAGDGGPALPPEDLFEDETTTDSERAESAA